MQIAKEKFTRALAYLRAENPDADISANPVVEHPHNTSRTIPERLSAATLKELSTLQPGRAVKSAAMHRPDASQAERSVAGNPA